MHHACEQRQMRLSAAADVNDRRPRDVVLEQLDDPIDRLVFHRRKRIVEHDPIGRMQHHACQRQRHLLILPKVTIPTLGRIEVLRIAPEARALEREHVVALCELVREQRIGEHFAQCAAR